MARDTRRPAAPSAYDLLGLSPGERDPEVIDAAVVRQSAYVRNFQAGRHADESARLLGEIAEAREVLLDPARRREHDASLTLRQSTDDESPGPGPPIALAITPPTRDRTDRSSPRRKVAALASDSALVILTIVLSGLWIFGPRRANHPTPVVQSGHDPLPVKEPRDANGTAVRSGVVGPKSPPDETLTTAPDGSVRPADAAPRRPPAAQGADLVAREPVASDGRPADRAPAGTAPLERPTSPGTGGGRESAELGEQDLYYDRIAAAQRELRAGDPGRARDTLARCPPTPRAWEWDYLLRQCGPARAEARGQEDRISEARDRAVAGLKAKAYRWDEGRVLQGHKSWVSSVTFSPDDRLIATGSGDGSVRLWDAATGRPVRTLSANQVHVFGVAFSSSGLRVAAAGNDGTARIWDVRSGNLLATLRGHGGPVTDVAYRPDGKRIATASKDGTVKVWDATNSKALATLTGAPASWRASVTAPTAAGSAPPPRTASCGSGTRTTGRCSSPCGVTRRGARGWPSARMGAGSPRRVGTASGCGMLRPDGRS